MEPKAGDRIIYSKARTTEDGKWAVPTQHEGTITATHGGGIVDLSFGDGTATMVPFSGEVFLARDPKAEKGSPEAEPVPYGAPGTWRWLDGGPTDAARVKDSPGVKRAQERHAAAVAKRTPAPAPMPEERSNVRRVTRTTEPTQLGKSDLPKGDSSR